MNFKEWILDLFRDERGGTSIKPLVALIGALTLCLAMVINVLYGKEWQPSDRLIEAVLVMTLGGLGGDTWDKFSTKNTSDQSAKKPKDEPKI
jgi:hypothetical protein